MATPVFADFTSADRRKKVVTYGRSSRLPAISKPAPFLHDDSPSPERSRKLVTDTSPSKKAANGQLKKSQTWSNTRSASGSVNVFEQPLDEVSQNATKPSLRPPTKENAPKDDFDVPDSDDESPAIQRPRKTIQPLRKGVASKSSALAPKPPTKSAKPKPPVSSNSGLSVNDTSSEVESKKLAPLAAVLGQSAKKGEQAQRKVGCPKATSRGTTPAAAVLKTSTSIPALKSAAAAPAKPSPRVEEADVFDLPMSDEEPSLPTPKPVRKSTLGGNKQKIRNVVPVPSERKDDTGDSDGSNKSRKRKRQEPASSASAVIPSTNRERDSSTTRRNPKQPKKLESAARNGTASGYSNDSSVTAGHRTAIPPSKPQRSRQRTVPMLARPAMAKGQSSPAKLSHMLPVTRPSMASPVTETLDGEVLEEGTMYEIPETQLTPMRTPKSTTSGSVTPRQKALFGNLLGSSSSSGTPLLSIQALQLTDRKPRSLLGALAKSKSDLSHNSQARKTKLISSLKTAEPSSEDEDDDDSSESDSDEEPRDVTKQNDWDQNRQASPVMIDSPTRKLPNDVDIDMDGLTESQNSQTTSGLGPRSRMTYATEKRSYLEEFNPEDELLMTMDIDNNMALGSQKKEGLSEDEGDPSQARAHHELKRQGQQALFNDDAQMHVEDISADKSASIRRSAMLDLATKMENTSFTSQLLDSAWAQDMVKNISSKGDTIFDFCAAIAAIYLISCEPSIAILHELSAYELTATLLRMLGNDMEIRKIAKDRKTNMSRIAQSSLASFRDLVERSVEWCPKALDKVSPQIAALKALDMILVATHLNRANEFDLGASAIASLVDLIGSRCKSLTNGSLSTHDSVTLTLAFSILQTISATAQKQTPWSIRDMQRLAEFMPAVFKAPDSSLGMLAVKLCMNLTNNKPKACQSFSGPMFIQSLVGSTLDKFRLQDTTVRDESRIEVLDAIILNLGTMINLAEFSDKARVNVNDGQDMIGTLVTLFVEGSERADQAETLAESQYGVAIGYLGVLLGNVCLNKTVRAKVRRAMPGQELSLITQKVKEFIGVHKDVDKSKEADGADSQEVWQNYTTRLMHVVENLESIEN